MNCVQCALKNLNMFGGSSSYCMNQLRLDNGCAAKFILMPIADNGSNRLAYSNGVVDGKMKLEAYVCEGCGHIDLKRSY